MKLTEPSLLLLRNVLVQQTLTVGQQGFLELAQQAAAALAELDAQLAVPTGVEDTGAEPE